MSTALAGAAAADFCRDEVEFAPHGGRRNIFVFGLMRRVNSDLEGSAGATFVSSGPSHSRWSSHCGDMLELARSPFRAREGTENKTPIQVRNFADGGACLVAVYFIETLEKPKKLIRRRGVFAHFAVRLTNIIQKKIEPSKR